MKMSGRRRAQRLGASKPCSDATTFCSMSFTFSHHVCTDSRMRIKEKKSVVFRTTRLRYSAAPRTPGLLHQQEAIEHLPTGETILIPRSHNRKCSHSIASFKTGGQRKPLQHAADDSHRKAVFRSHRIHHLHREYGRVVPGGCGEAART